MLQDLPKPCHNFKNWSGWILTSWRCSFWFCANLDWIGWNRCPVMMRKMNGSGTLAQHSFNDPEFASAMNMLQVQQWWFFKIFHDSSSTDALLCLQVNINTRTSKKNSEIWWIQVKKVWEKLREFGEFWIWIWDCDCGSRNSVMIKAI